MVNKMAYTIRYSTIYSDSLQVDRNKTLKFNLESDMYADGCVINVREFIESMKDTGPTKNGLFYHLNSIEELNEIQQKFNELFNEARKQLEFEENN